jgi:OmpA-OmpF porin, OOP family
VTTRRSLQGKWTRLAATLLSIASAAAALLAPARARAQSTTFYLDRLQIAGAPGDGLALWRPEIGPTRLYGQLALGSSRNPLRADNLVDDRDVAKTFSGPPVAFQITSYLTAGMELSERGAIQVTLPVTVYQTGSPTDNPAAGVGQAVRLAPAALADLRIDGRVALARSESGLLKLGARAALFLPIGDERSFTGDSGVWGNVGLAAELDFKSLFVTLNGGASIRPKTTLNQLTVGSELTYGLAVYLPLLHDRLRLGAEVFGSAGLLPQTAGDLDNAALEWSLNGRLFFNDRHSAWLGLGAGTRLTDGYAPNLRAVALFGGALAFAAREPVVITPVADAVKDADSDKDGLSDAEDACPIEPEDGVHPGDGCPEPLDSDKDGIPNTSDACPDQPEDKDGIDDSDGCPENDADGDGFADSADKCPKEPGVHGDDPEKEGCPQFIRRVSTEVKLFKQVEFEFGQSAILPRSYPILDEVARLLKANPDIKRLDIEGHTDNVGTEEFNESLSRTRAAAVKDYLAKRGGVEAGRLTFKGFGATRPLASNDTDEGRAQNRRVELHIVTAKAPAP